MLGEFLSVEIQASVLRPGESFSKTIPLNIWALMNEPGRYEIIGSYHAHSVSYEQDEWDQSAPITINVSSRTNKEMEDYINGLTNQITARLPIQANQVGVRNDPVVDKLLTKLMYTCSPEMVPMLLRIMYEPGFGGNAALLAWEGLLNCAPRTEETRKTILDAVARGGFNRNIAFVLTRYDLDKPGIKPLIERALGVLNPGEWQSGATLTTEYYDDSFLTRLIAIASGTNASDNARGAAITALARNRTDEGVKTLKTLLNDPDPNISYAAERAIRFSYTSRGDARGRPLRADDFDAKFQQPEATPAK